MTPTQVHHVPLQEYSRRIELDGCIEFREDERLSPALAVPLIAGLSTAMWAAIWYAGRSLMGS
jgi:hypothetical protein